MHPDGACQPLEGNDQSVFTVQSAGAETSVKTTANKLIDYSKCCHLCMTTVSESVRAWLWFTLLCSD